MPLSREKPFCIYAEVRDEWRDPKQLHAQDGDIGFLRIEVALVNTIFITIGLPTTQEFKLKQRSYSLKDTTFYSFIYSNTFRLWHGRV